MKNLGWPEVLIFMTFCALLAFIAHLVSESGGNPSDILEHRTVQGVLLGGFGAGLVGIVKKYTGLGG